MTERYSPLTGLKRWFENRKIALAIKHLHQEDKLKRLLDDSSYTYLHPGSFQGDDWYHVLPKGSASQQDIIFSSLDENHAIWWIIEYERKSAQR